MPTYVYETCDGRKPVRRFEHRQSIKDNPLTVDPDSLRPVKRVITSGAGILTPGAAGAAARSRPTPSRGGCGSGCCCHSH